MLQFKIIVGGGHLGLRFWPFFASVFRSFRFGSSVFRFSTALRFVVVSLQSLYTNSQLKFQDFSRIFQVNIYKNPGPEKAKVTLEATM